MNSTLYDEIVKLDAATRLQLAQDLLESVASETFTGPLTAEQRTELRLRLAHHRAHPEEADVSLAEPHRQSRLRRVGGEFMFKP